MKGSQLVFTAVVFFLFLLLPSCSAQERKQGYSINTNALLLSSAYMNDIDGAAAALENGANINTRNTEGNTALIFAAMEGHMDMVRFLLEKGANKSVNNNEGLSAARVANKYDYIDISSFIAAYPPIKKDRKGIKHQ